MGSARAQYHLRQVCVFYNLYLLNRPETFCNAFADCLDQEGDLVGDKAQKLIKQLLRELSSLTGKLC